MPAYTVELSHRARLGREKVRRREARAGEVLDVFLLGLKRNPKPRNSRKNGMVYSISLRVPISLARSSLLVKVEWLILDNDRKVIISYIDLD